MNYYLPINPAVGSPATAVVQMVGELNRLSTAMAKLTGTINQLEHSASHLRKNVLVGNVLFGAAQNAAVARPRVLHNTDPEDRGAIRSSTDKNEVIETLTNIGKLGEATKKVVESMCNLPAGLDKVPAALEIPAGMASAVQGYTDLETKESTTVGEKISIGTNILIGAAAKAIAGFKFGLQGLIVATVAEAIATYVSIANEKERQQKQLKTAQRLQYERAMRTFTMDEQDSDAYIGNIVELPLRHRWKIRSKPTDEVIKAYGQHAYDLTIPVPLQATDQLNPRLYVPTTVNYDTKADRLPRERSYFEKTFGLQRSLIGTGMTDGNNAFLQATLEAREKAKQFDLVHHTNTLARTELAIKESAYDLLNKANSGHMVADALPIAGKSRSENPARGKAVVVNLNKALIEHFTVNTADVREGVEKLKEQVEVALLQILNSAVQ